MKCLARCAGGRAEGIAAVSKTFCVVVSKRAMCRSNMQLYSLIASTLASVADTVRSSTFTVSLEIPRIWSVAVRKCRRGTWGSNLLGDSSFAAYAGCGRPAGARSACISYGEGVRWDFEDNEPRHRAPALSWRGRHCSGLLREADPLRAAPQSHRARRSPWPRRSATHQLSGPLPTPPSRGEWAPPRARGVRRRPCWAAQHQRTCRSVSRFMVDDR